MILKPGLDPITLFIHTERYVNKGAYHSFRDYSQVSKAYRPKDGKKDFPLPFLLTENGKNVEYLEAKPSSKIKKLVKQNEVVKFFFHPDMEDEYRKFSILSQLNSTEAFGFYKAIPTSSTRTLLVKSDSGYHFMVKIDLGEKRIGRLKRDLGSDSVKHSSRVAFEIEEVLEEDRVPESFAYFPEVIGLIFKGERELGNIFREFEPRPKVSGKRFFFPLFSLYSTDFKNPSDPFLITQLVDINQEDPLKFFKERLARLILENFFFWASKYGILLECHVQNMLLEVDSNFIPTRIIHRDLQASVVDLETRRRKGLNIEGFSQRKIIGNRFPQKTRFEEYSTMYDHRIGYQTLDEIISILVESFGEYGVSDYRQAIHEIFIDCLGKYNIDSREFFPSGFYYLFKDGMWRDSRLRLKRLKGSPYRP